MRESYGAALIVPTPTNRPYKSRPREETREKLKAQERTRVIAEKRKQKRGKARRVYFSRWYCGSAIFDTDSFRSCELLLSIPLAFTNLSESLVLQVCIDTQMCISVVCRENKYLFWWYCFFNNKISRVFCWHAFEVRSPSIER